MFCTILTISCDVQYEHAVLIRSCVFKTPQLSFLFYFVSGRGIKFRDFTVLHNATGASPGIFVKDVEFELGTIASNLCLF